MWWLVLLAVVLGAYVLATRRRRLPARVPPLYPGALPLLGHLHLFIPGSSVDIWNAVKDMSETTLLWGGVMSCKLGLKHLYAIADPDDCLTVANSSLHKHYIYDSMKPALGNGLFTSDVTAMGGAMVDETLKSKYLLATEDFFQSASQRLFRNWLHSDTIFKISSISKQMENSSKIIREVTNVVLKNRKRNLGKDTDGKSGTKFKAFIDLILECSGENGLLSDQDVKEELDTIIFGGTGTIATTLLFSLVLLGSHPDVQERALKEVTETVGDRDVEKEDLPKLVYVEAVLKETMRLYPIGPIVIRNLKEDVKLKNYTLPAGSGAVIAIYALQRHAMWGSDAGQFVPERWLDKARLPTHQAAYCAFSIGPRMCIGKKFAIMSMKITLAHIVRSLRIQADASKMHLKMDITLKPHAGHHISVERRM